MRRDPLAQAYAEHAQAIYGYLTYRVGNGALAEDLLADTFERFLRKQATFDARKGSTRTWLFAIATNVARDNARRTRAETRALARVGVPDSAVEFADIAERRHTVREAVADLPDNEREALALRYGADLALKDVARILDEPLSTAEARVYSGLRRLRTVLVDD